VKPSDITWEILDGARAEIDRLRGQMTPEAYEDDKRSLQAYLCNYFNSDDGKDCDAKQGKAISPVGFSTGQGGKCLKVRWAVPGQGKSGGLRLAVVADCEAKRVKLAGAWLRRDDPEDADFAAAVARG
jgi:hypothetical protein